MGFPGFGCRISSKTQIPPLLGGILNLSTAHLPLADSRDKFGLDKPLPLEGILKMMNSKRKKDVIKRINYVIGDLTSIRKMIEQGKNSSDIFVQLRSVESAFRKSILGTFEAEHRMELAERIVEELENCPGSCEYCELVETLKRDFPKLSLTQVLNGLHKIKKRSR
jgi:DNA-binding FrmR family transcriptional regulator